MPDTEEITIKASPAPVIPGPQILDETEAYLRRFVIFPKDEHYAAVALWCAATHAHLAFSTFPRLAFLAPEPASGKTRALEITLQMCHLPRMELDPTGPGIMNIIATTHPTIGIDETDTIFGKSGSSAAKQQLRSILNSGYKAGAMVTRKQGATFLSVPVFGPIAFAGLGQLPETLMTRSVVIRMRRRRPEEHTEPYFSRTHAPTGAMIGESLGRWVSLASGRLADAWPELPEGIQDRAAEVWEPLLAVADEAGAHWPDRARGACRALALDRNDSAGPTPSQRVLADIRRVWPDAALAVSSTDLSNALRDLDGAPWASMWPAQAGQRELAAYLAPHGIAPIKVKIDGRALQGYRLETMKAAWQHIGTEGA